MDLRHLLPGSTDSSKVANDADRAEHSLDLVRIWTRWVERRDDLGEYWQVVDAQRHTKRG